MFFFIFDFDLYEYFYSPPLSGIIQLQYFFFFHRVFVKFLWCVIKIEHTSTLQRFSIQCSIPRQNLDTDSILNHTFHNLTCSIHLNSVHLDLAIVISIVSIALSAAIIKLKFNIQIWQYFVFIFRLILVDMYILFLYFYFFPSNFNCQQSLLFMQIKNCKHFCYSPCRIKLYVNCCLKWLCTSFVILIIFAIESSKLRNECTQMQFIE